MKRDSIILRRAPDGSWTVISKLRWMVELTFKDEREGRKLARVDLYEPGPPLFGSDGTLVPTWRYYVITLEHGRDGAFMARTPPGWNALPRFVEEVPGRYQLEAIEIVPPAAIQETRGG